MREEIRKIQGSMEGAHYVTDPAIATAVYLAMTLQKPLLVEGHAGVGKTEIAKVLARVLDTNLIRLQCYEGLDAGTALYEWNYPKQLLRIKLEEREERSLEAKEADLLGPVPPEAAPAPGHYPGGAGPCPAGRRDRPGRPRVRELPPGGALRLPGDHSRDRHHRGDAPPVRRADLQSLPRPV